jgi:acetyl-CoA C-acetyltransferase
MKEAVIVSAVRTPIGALNGSLSSLSAPALGSIAIGEALARGGVSGGQVDAVIMGNVISAGVGQAPARQAALKAGLPDTVSCTTVNKVCGSGLSAVMIGVQAIRLGEAKVVVAGGMESMSNAPYLLDRARSGYRMGHAALLDSLIKDGLCDAAGDFHMGAAIAARTQRSPEAKSKRSSCRCQRAKRTAVAQLPRMNRLSASTLKKCAR